ncbi:MAG: hydroxyethylthiazole kinase [Bilophila wadsworthia]
MNPFENILSAVRQKRPLVHFITNYVTVNDCANMTLALGGSPIMADDLREVEQIVGHCSALVLNIGTLSERTVQSCWRQGRRPTGWAARGIRSRGRGGFPFSQ